MAVNPTIKLRSSGTPLTNNEIDQNFTNIKDAVVAVGSQVDTVQLDLSNFTSSQTATNVTINNELNNIDDRLDTLESGITGVTGSLGDYVKRDGSNAFLGNINAGSNRLVNLSSPTTDTDATTKKYVDDLDIFNFKTDGSKSLTGNLNLSGNKITNISDPVDDSDATNKIYVDTSLSGAIASLDFTPYLKSDGSVALSANLNAGLNKITNVSDPINSGDATNKEYVDTSISTLYTGTIQPYVKQQKTFLTETTYDILDTDIYSADAVPATWAYEFAMLELNDKIIFDSSVDIDNVTFPNKSYVANVKFSDIYANFPDNFADLKLVNRSTSKLLINVYLNDGVTKIATIPPSTYTRLQWKGSDVDPVWLITINENYDLYKKTSNNFLKFAVAFNDDGTIKANHEWLGQLADNSNAFSLNVNHVPSSGIYTITWSNGNSYDGSGNLFSPVVIPTLILTSADIHDYAVYVKDLTSSGCTIETRRIGHALEDKSFSLVVGGHNSPDGNNFNNPFLV